MSTTILVIGLMVFFAHFLSLQFGRTNIREVPGHSGGTSGFPSITCSDRDRR